MNTKYRVQILEFLYYKTLTDFKLKRDAIKFVNELKKTKTNAIRVLKIKE